ncbi:Cytoskeletal protein syp1 [Paramyrothecium foliicola]|nr:Cytoskeletal protein syp1 [Paramyrothecium foliicola]
MDDVVRAEYPAILVSRAIPKQNRLRAFRRLGLLIPAARKQQATLQPGQAVQVLSERIKRISKINTEIADWLQERRRVEEQYVLSLRKLGQFKVPNSQSELGVFQGPWNRITEAVENIAQTHHRFAERVEKDVEQPLRQFQTRKDVQNMNTISANLGTMARDLEDAQDKIDKLTRKGGKANTQKVEAATARLESATQQWQSQAPFIFETLQALDESRVNQLRDVLTQYQTHEADAAQQTQDHAAATLAIMIEISTDTEVLSFAQKITGGKVRAPTRTSTRQSSVVGTQSSTTPQLPPTPNIPSVAPTPIPPTPIDDDNASEHNSLPPEPKSASRSSRLGRIGTVFGRRRQSMVGGFNQLSPSKPPAPGFGRIGSSHSRVSPRTSSTNLNESSHLSSLAETPDADRSTERFGAEPKEGLPTHEGTNGDSLREKPAEAAAPNVFDEITPVGTNGTHESGAAAGSLHAPTQPTQQTQPIAQGKDSEGFTVPPEMDDPISRAQREAAGNAEEADQAFKLNIQDQPIEEEDPEAKQAALSNVFNTLKQGPATRRSGTVRGRRDVRNTIYVPAPGLSENSSGFPSVPSFPSIPGSPPLAKSPSKPSAVAALASEASVGAGSDRDSIRSATSFGSLANVVKHPEMTGPGLNASIIETVSAVFEDGTIKSATVVGEVALVHNASDPENPKGHEIIRINNFANLEKIGPNRIFVQNSTPDQPDQFSLDLSHLTKTAPAFSYRVFADETQAATLSQHAPLVVKPTWKPQDDKLGLLLQYQLNPEFMTKMNVTLHNVAFVVQYNGKANQVQTKPSGTHVKEKHLVYWRLGDVKLTSEMQKIVCRIVGADGVAPTPGQVHAKWEYVSSTEDEVENAISLSRLEEGKGKGKEVEDDPFADDSLAGSTHGDQRWVDVPLVRKLVSGDYEGKASV